MRHRNGSVQVQVLTAPDAGSDASAMICPGESIDLNTLVTGTSGGSWSAGPIVNAEGTYTYVVNNSCGSDEATFTVEVMAQPTAGTGTTITVCTGTVIDLDTLLTGADAGGAWSTGDNMIVANNDALYTYSVSSVCGNDAASVAVNVMNAPSAGIGHNITVCAGTEVDLDTLITGAAAGGSWSNGTALVTANTTGSYTYTVSNDCGSEQTTVTISVTDPPSAGTATNLTVCAGSTLDLNSLLNGEDQGGTWSNGSNTIVADSTNSYTYTVSNGCGSAATTVTVGVTQLLSAGTGSSTTVCPGTILDLDSLLSGADQGGTWNGGSNLIVATTTAAYTYSIANGCGSDQATVNVNVSALPTAGADATTTLCPGGTVDLAGLMSGDQGGSYSAGPVVSIAGTYSYILNTACGSDTATFTILLGVAPNAGQDAAAVLCEGQSIDLNTLLNGANASGVWSDGPEVSTSGIYTYAVTNSCGMDIAEFSVVVNPVPLANAGNDDSVCGLSYAMQALAPVGSGTWSAPAGVSFNDVTDPLATATVTTSGQYSLVWNVSNGPCEASDTVMITFQAPVGNLFLEAGPDQVLDLGTTTSLDAQAAPGTTVNWSVLSGSGVFNDPTDLSTTISGLSIGTNMLMLQASFGPCAAGVDTLIIEVNDLFIPQGYSPNGDGTNDVFKITGINAYPGNEFKVFNRWGLEVFVRQGLPERLGRPQQQRPDAAGRHLLLHPEPNGGPDV